jgi:anti-sigma regulatory factor (Ser/Thr protein kinase)/anti-anti-sigma regulatory factor
MTVLIRTSRNMDNGVTTVSVAGELTMAALPAVRSAVAKSVVDCPVAVIVELSDLTRAAHGLLSVFSAAARKAAQDQGVAVLLCGAVPDVARGLLVFDLLSPIYPGYADAVAAVDRATPRWRHERLTPTPAAASLARILVGDACLAWSLPHLQHPARLVVSELAANAIEHAGSDFDVTVALSRRYLRVAVEDRSAVPPRLQVRTPFDPQAPLADRGRGLHIIDDAAAHWGVTALDTGKIVWALLRAWTATPRSGPAPAAAR